jgi:cytochrome c biogenesis protein CcmG/thiol:disulfide interchange protein DsbE
MPDDELEPATPSSSGSEPPATSIGTETHRSRFGGTRGRVLLAFVVGVALVGVWLVLWNSGKDAPSAHRSTQGMPARVDRPAPDFTRQLLSDRGAFRLGSPPDHVTVVNFWASWCTACRSETPELDRIARAFRGKGVRFVGVDYEDSRHAAVTFARSFHLTYPLVFDPNGGVGSAFGIFGLPTTFILGPDGRIHYVISGKLRVPSFTAALGSLLTPDASAAPAG